MTTQKPTVLIVHGAWHTPSHFDRILKLFEDAGYPTSCNLHPSIDSVNLGLMDDAQLINSVLTRLIDDEGKDVIVIAHSYGGMVTAQSAEAELAKKLRQDQGKKGGILHLIYMTAFLLPIGGVSGDAYSGEITPDMFEIFEDGLCYMKQPAMRFYHDCSEEDQQRAIAGLRKTSLAIGNTKLTKACYRYHPLTYILCEHDQVVPYTVQLKMVNNIKNTGLKIATETLPASHSPFISMPTKILELVDNIQSGKTSL